MLKNYRKGDEVLIVNRSWVGATISVSSRVLVDLRELLLITLDS